MFGHYIRGNTRALDVCVSEWVSFLSYLKWWSWFCPWPAGCSCYTWKHKPLASAQCRWSPGSEHPPGSPAESKLRKQRKRIKKKKKEGLFVWARSKFKNLFWSFWPLQRTTFHFFPSSSSTGGSVRVGVADAAGLAALEAKGFGPERTGAPWLLRLGFLWVFWLSDTCFSPAGVRERWNMHC